MDDSRPKVTTLSGEEFLKIGEVARSFWENGESGTPPQFVVFMGGVGSGKTTIRRQQFAKGYVHFDSGEIYTAFKKRFGKDHPRLNEYVAVASDMIFRESMEAKKNIVIEIIGDSYEAITPVIDKMRDAGYNISVQGITCDIAEAYKRHLKAVSEDWDYLSSYFTQEATLAPFYAHFELGTVPDAVKAKE